MSKSGSSKKVDARDAQKAVAFVDLATTLIEKFGWPGAFLLAGYSFVILYATEEQKQEIVSLYVLGRGIELAWPLVASSALFLVVLFAQRSWYRKKLLAMQEELAREGREKSKLQERLLGKGLRHVGDQKQEVRGRP